MRAFFVLFIGQTISQMGSSMTSFAVIIWAYSEGGQVMASSLLAVCSAVPYLITSLLGGTVADRTSKKKVMLVCDTVAAAGSLVILACFMSNHLQLWILCIVNIVNGFMNAFQGPASQVAVSLLIDKSDYVRIEGLRSAVSSAVGVIQPVLAAAFLSVGGLGLILTIDLGTFLFAFVTLLVWVKIPETDCREKGNTIHTLKREMAEGIHYLKRQEALLLFLISYGILEFVGAVSFDSMYSPLLLARTGNHEMTVGIVSGFMAAGCVVASLLLTLKGEIKRRIPVMFAGSLLCLTGITLFGMGRNIYWWCAVAFCGCFGSPIYTTMQTAILREQVPVGMQGRMFAMQGMITQILAPVGYLTGAVLADYVFEPFMQGKGTVQKALSGIVGSGAGSGIGLIFVLAGAIGIILLLLIYSNSRIRTLDIMKEGE